MALRKFLNGQYHTKMTLHTKQKRFVAKGSKSSSWLRAAEIRYWKRHRGVGFRPIGNFCLDAIGSVTSEKAIARIVWFALAFAVIINTFGHASSKVTACSGLVLVIVGVLLIFREWIMQFRESEDAGYRDIDRKVGWGWGDDRGPMTFDDDGPQPVEISRHLAHGLREQLQERATPALGGIVCLVGGFALQFVASLMA